MIARTIELRQKDRRAILQIAREVLPDDAELWAYGSRVKGTAHDASDLDLVIKTPAEAPLSSEQLTHFREALRDSNLPIFVDVFDWRLMLEGFRERIATYHVKLA